MGDHEVAAVQHVVADQAVHETLSLGPEILWFRFQLGERLGQAMGNLHAATAHGADELVLVVAWHAQRAARADHAHDESQHPRRVRSTVNEVPDEDGAAGLVRRADGTAELVSRDGIAELGKQHLKLGAAAVDVADDVERTGLLAQIVEQRGTRDRRGGDLVLVVQDVDGPEALLLQAAQAPP